MDQFTSLLLLLDVIYWQSDDYYSCVPPTDIRYTHSGGPAQEQLQATIPLETIHKLTQLRWIFTKDLVSCCLCQKLWHRACTNRVRYSLSMQVLQGIDWRDLPRKELSTWKGGWRRDHHEEHYEPQEIQMSEERDTQKETVVTPNAEVETLAPFKCSPSNSRHLWYTQHA